MKKMIGLIGLIIYLFSIITPYNYYCRDFIGYGDIIQIIFSICFINNILHAMFILGALFMLSNEKENIKTVILFILFIIFLGIFLQYINSGTFQDKLFIQFTVLLQMFKSYIGSFLGIFLGIIYFKQVKSVKKGLLFLILLWLLINIIYPLIK